MTAILTISLLSLRRNYRLLKNMANSGARAGAAVKANAYGLGAAEVSKALFAEGCRDFFVFTPEEGIALRRVLSAAAIYVLRGFQDDMAEEYPSHDLIPVLGSLSQIDAYKNLAARENKKLPAFLDFNTGMNRMGLQNVEAEKLAADPSLLQGIDVKCIMSHFACADEPGHPMNESQYENFRLIAKNFPLAEKSLANSSGIIRDRKYHFDLLRPGIALYGGNPAPETKNPMEPVVSLYAPVIRTRAVGKGEGVGYNATYVFNVEGCVATVAAGYADGFPRSLSNKGALCWKDYRCPIRGRVSMDLVTVDLSAVPESERPRPGEMMEILGPHQDIEALAKDAGTISYEILTSLGNRYRREYVSE